MVDLANPVTELQSAPWMSTKKFFVLLALLIPRKQSTTVEVFDVYIEPLVEELLELWTAIATYDVTKPMGYRIFKYGGLRVVLMLTIHDFPGYGIAGGFAYQGYAACPWCGPELGAKHSVELGKQTYGGTRRWLPENHRYRSDVIKDHFNDTMERCPKPKPVFVEEQLQYAIG